MAASSATSLAKIETVSVAADSESVAASDLGICCTPGCGVVLRSRRECPICKKMKIVGSYFCSHDCYKANWKEHKKIHKTQEGEADGPPDGKSDDKSDASVAEERQRNAAEALVISVVPGDAEVSLVTLMSPFKLEKYGDYIGEKKELESTLGWRFNKIGETKFYPKDGCQWYFFGYYDKDAKKKREPLNKAVSVAAGRDIYGKCLILPSGPMGNESYYTGVKIRFVDLAESLSFYRNKNPDEVFQERELRRSMTPSAMSGGLKGLTSGAAFFHSFADR